MNPTSLPPQPPPPLPPQPPLQPHRPSTSCNRHPEENFTGFCPSCLCERLAVLDPNSSAPASSSSRKPPTSSTAVAALKAIFRPSSSSSAAATATGRNNRPPTSSFLPELRRTQSFSASKNEGFSGVVEPQRKSCDVRARSSLWNLFSQDTEKKTLNKEASLSQEHVVETKEEENREENNVEGEVVVVEEEAEAKEEIRVLEEPNVNVIEDRVEEIVEEEEEEEGVVIEEEELKTMKDHIDLDSSQAKKGSRDFKGSFWSAASVFSKKLQKWRQKQKMKKHRNGGGNDDGASATLPVEKPIGRQFRDTQSEIADYGFGRRSCDIDPRFSLDIGRISFEDPRYSLDEPRASWDGYLIGRTTIPRMPAMPTMLSVVEDAPVHVLRTDTQIPVEEPMNSTNEGDGVPGGTTQTREYYSDSSSRRRKSLDRSNSIRKTAAAVVAEIDELKSVSGGSIANANAKVTPASVDYINGVKMGLLDRDLRDLSSNSMRDDCCSETFDMGFRDNASVIGNGDRKGSKKSRRWGKGWSIWGLIHRRGGNKDEDEDRYSRANGVERSFSESWQELRGDGNGDSRGASNGRMFRSNSSVSWRNAQNIGGSFGNGRRNSFHGNGHGKKAKDEFVLERNRSARYSPNNIDNGLLRLYLTPLRGSRRNGSVKSRSKQAQSITRSVPRLYSH